MKRLISLFLIVFAVFVLLPVASAQSLTDPSSWPSYWANVGALAGLVLIAVQFLKLHVLAGFLNTKWHTILLSVLIGIVLGLVGMAAGFYHGAVGAAILFGLQAGLIASGFKDLVNTLRRKPVTVTSQNTTVNSTKEPHLDPGTGTLPR